MKAFSSGDALSKEMGIDSSVLEKTFQDYNEVARLKKDPFGKKFFHNMPFSMKDSFYVALITPVLHYTVSIMKI